MPQASSTSQPQLLRVLGPVGATAVVVGSVIGSGIFFKANVVAQSVGRFDVVLLAWVVCGVLSLFGALAFAELGAMMPHAGGQYVYLREAFGPLSGFLWGWGEFWMMRTGSTAALAVAFAESLWRSLGPLLMQPGGSADGVSEGPAQFMLAGIALNPVWLTRGIAIGAILSLTLVNVVGARWGGLMQNVTTFIKAGLLLALLVLPFLSGTAAISNATSTFHRPGGLGLFAGFAAAMTAVFWAYDGWNNIGPVAEEVRNPQRNIPLALFFGMFILIALYLGATVAYHLVLNMEEIAESKFVAATACEKMLGTYGASIASAAVMISTFGALNANLFVGPRVIFAMARDRLFLAPMARIHPRFRTPHVSIIAESIWAMLLILGADLLTGIRVPAWVASLPASLGGPLAASIEGMGSKAIFDVLTDYVVFGQFVFYLLSVIAVFVLRVRRPDMERPYKTFGYPWLPLIFVLGSSGFLIGMFLTSPVESILGLMFIGMGAIAFQFRPRVA